MKIYPIINIFSKAPRLIGDAISIAHVNRTEVRQGVVIGKHADNPRYQNRDIGKARLVNTAKDMYIVSLGEKK